MTHKRWPLFSLIIAGCCIQAATSSPMVKIFSYDEAFGETSVSKPRIYIQNLEGSVAISNFYYYYYFTVESSKTPILEDYYTPKSTPTLQSLGSGNYRINLLLRE